MPKRKKRKVEESEDVSTMPSEVDQPESRLEATVVLAHIRNSDTANETERGLMRLLWRICARYSDRYQQGFSKTFVNQHLAMFSILGLPVELSYKSSVVHKDKICIGAHSACTKFHRANRRREGGNYNLTEIVRLHERTERVVNMHTYSKLGLAVPSFTIRRNVAVLFRQLMTVNTLIVSRSWSELGRYLNSCPFLHEPLVAWFYNPQRKTRPTFTQREYRSVRHDMFVSALYVWQAATLRVLHSEESREWQSSRQLDILRRCVSQCGIVRGVRVPEHVLLTDSVAVMISLEEAYMIQHMHIIDMNLPAAHEIYRRPYEAFKLLAQSSCWQDDLRIISGVTEPGSNLIEELMDVAEREGSAGVVFALAALRGFMKIAEVVESTASLDRLLAYSIACPRAARPLAAQMREYGMEEQADELIDKAIDPSSAIHPSDPVWLEWAEGQMKDLEEDDEKTCTKVATVLLAYLDYGSNRLHERAWILLGKAMDGSDSSHWIEWWDERSEWWPEFHKEEMEKRGDKARRNVFKRFAKVDRDGLR